MNPPDSLTLSLWDSVPETPGSPTQPASPKQGPHKTPNGPEKEPDDITTYVRNLQQQLRQATEAYTEGKPSGLSDGEFDLLLAQLEEMERQNPHLRSPESPTQEVGPAVADERNRVELLRPMLSLDKAFSPEEIREWNERTQRQLGRNPGAYSAELKYDGLSVEIVYDHGAFHHASTRGNGTHGQDISGAVRRIPNLPLTLPERSLPAQVAVRAEALLTHDHWELLNALRAESGDKPTENARAAAAGALQDENPDAVGPTLLSLWAYGAAWPTGTVPPVQTQSALLDLLEEWGFQVGAHERCTSIEQALSFCERIAQEREQMDHAIDGTVLKVDDLSIQEELGSATKHPRWAIARKYPAEYGETELTEIQVQVGRFGFVTPVAVLEPVRVGGTTITSATLHNEAEIQRKDIRIGDRVVVERAGDVIPRILRTRTDLRNGNEKPWRFPEQCPGCGGPISRPVSHVLPASRTRKEPMPVLGARHVCDNPACSAQRIRRILHFGSRAALDIQGLGQVAAESICNANLLQDVSGIFELQVEDLQKLPGFGRAKSEALIQAILSSRDQPLPRVLYGLGIRHVGRSASRILSEHFTTLNELLDAPESQIAGISGIGAVIAHSWHHWAQQASSRALLERLRKAGLTFPNQTAGAPTSSGPLQGQSVVITGTLPGITRSEAERILHHSGARISGSVSRKTSFLVVGSDAGGKLEQAQKLGIPCLSWEETQKRIQT